ncbi:MAG: c-type cytochrome [Oceanisphaera sp.]|uniref:c-type cytochrome n=1 Tax=Oceanisphaera sp. TaxID=1929979 RepID=UPI003F95A24C
MSQNEHRAQRREAPEPEEGSRGVPKLVIAWIVLLLIWGVGYYIWQIGKPMLGGDSRSVPEQVVASTEGGDNAIDGGAIYNAQCSACHQATGQGIAGAFPPLADSEWLLADPNIAVSIVHDGLQGPIEVHGGTYAGVMPPFGGNLSNAEIAAVLTHVRSEWGNDASAVDLDVVDAHEDKYGQRGPWTAEELTAEFGAP